MTVLSLATQWKKQPSRHLSGKFPKVCFLAWHSAYLTRSIQAIRLLLRLAGPMHHEFTSAVASNSLLPSNACPPCPPFLLARLLWPLKVLLKRSSVCLRTYPNGMTRHLNGIRDGVAVCLPSARRRWTQCPSTRYHPHLGLLSFSI